LRAHLVKAAGAGARAAARDDWSRPRHCTLLGLREAGEYFPARHGAPRDTLNEQALQVLSQEAGGQGRDRWGRRVVCRRFLGRALKPAAGFFPVGMATAGVG